VPSSASLYIRKGQLLYGTSYGNKLRRYFIYVSSSDGRLTAIFKLHFTRVSNILDGALSLRISSAQYFASTRCIYLSDIGECIEINPAITSLLIFHHLKRHFNLANILKKLAF